MTDLIIILIFYLITSPLHVWENGSCVETLNISDPIQCGNHGHYNSNDILLVNGKQLIPLPEGTGLSARYPDDLEIEKDPAVLFTEDFEGFKGERISRSETGGWDNFYGDLIITRTPASVHQGKQALQVTHTKAPWSHGAVKEVAGHDTLFVRFYMKFHPQFPGCHHAGFYIRGGQPGSLHDEPTGTRPTGQDHFTVALDHHFSAKGKSPFKNKTPPGWTHNYCYHMDQKNWFFS